LFFIGVKEGDSVKQIIHSSYYNLKPLYFDSYEYEYLTGSHEMDSIKNMYVYANYTRVRIDRCFVEIKFFIDATSYMIARFRFSKEKDTWLLDRIEEWSTFNPEGSGDVLLINSKIKNDADRCLLKEFNILNYLE
jgi:hypothetical protein